MAAAAKSSREAVAESLLVGAMDRKGDTKSKTKTEKGASS
jgi:hypothetical protein